MVYLLVISVQIIVLLVWVRYVLSVGMGSGWSITRVLLNVNSHVNNAQLLMPPIAHHVLVGIH